MFLFGVGIYYPKRNYIGVSRKFPSQGCEKTTEESELYEETPDELGWHRPVDRRAYRAQLACERAAWKPAHG